MSNDEYKFMRAIKNSFCGLSFPEIREIITEIKNGNNGSLEGLTKTTIMSFVSKRIHDKHIKLTKKMKKDKKELNETCPLCFKIFSQHGTRNRHMKNVHGCPVPTLDRTGFDQNCPNCNKSFKYEFSLDYHIETVHTEKCQKKSDQASVETPSFECKLCSRVFKEEYTLTRHIRIHSGDEYIQCERCPARFTRHDNLLKHEKRVHSVGDLNVELIRQSGKKFFVCKMCGRNFHSDRTLYEAHLLLKICRQKQIIELDSNLRFACDQCEKSYAEKDSLDRHIRWKHGLSNKQFEC